MGIEQAAKQFQALGNLVAADDVRLVLPETGVCSMRMARAGAAPRPQAAASC